MVLFEKFDENRDGKLDFIEYVKGRFSSKYEIPDDELRNIAALDATDLMIKLMGHT